MVARAQHYQGTMGRWFTPALACTIGIGFLLSSARKWNDPHDLLAQVARLLSTCAKVESAPLLESIVRACIGLEVWLGLTLILDRSRWPLMVAVCLLSAFTAVLAVEGIALGWQRECACASVPGYSSLPMAILRNTVVIGLLWVARSTHGGPTPSPGGAQ